MTETARAYVHNLSPIAFELGPLAIRWYGLMYLLGFVLFLLLGKLRAKRCLARHELRATSMTCYSSG